MRDGRLSPLDVLMPNIKRLPGAYFTIEVGGRLLSSMLTGLPRRGNSRMSSGCVTILVN